MKPFKYLLLALILIACGTVNAQIPAFPGAEGFGAYASGGRGGDVYIVTSLANNGAGTLRDALNTVPPEGRTIVFAVSGYIPVVSDTNFQVPANVTIAGQTAPGDGVGLVGGRMLIAGNNTIMRHFRIRHGKYGTGGDCLNIASGVDDTMIDHISMMFSTDENFSFFGGYPDNFTMQYSSSAWGMERHNAGGLWDLNHGTCHHSLWAHHRTRNPKARPGGLLEWINNVTYHWRSEGFIMGDSTGDANWYANIIGCYYISIDDWEFGTDSTPLSKARLRDSDGLPNFHLYLDDTLIDYNSDGVLNGTDQGYSIVSGTPDISPTPFAGAPVAVSTDDPLTAYKKVISATGPLRLDANASSLRDELDDLLIESVTNEWDITVAKDSPVTSDPDEPPSNGEYLLAQQYGISNDGLGSLSYSTGPADTDSDGMPDDWELALGSNVASQNHNTVFANNGSIITASTFFPPNTEAGYTYLEEYLHFCAIPHGWMAKNTAEQPTSLTVDLSRYTDGFTDTPVFTISSVVGGSVNQTGSVIEFTPTQDSYGRAGFDFTVTDADGSSWTQQFAILVTMSAEPRDLVWVGGNNGNAWDATTVNWETSGSSPTTFSVGDSVLFDNGGNNAAISVSSNLIVQSMTVSGSQNYSFSGPGTVSVVDTFTNSSSGILTLSTAISTGSGTLLDGGETILNTSGNLSGGGIRLTNGATITDNTGGSQLLLSPDLQVSSGETGTLDLSTRADVNGALAGAGTLNIDVNAAGDYFAGDWSAFTGQLNVTANSGAGEFRINRGYDNGFKLSSGRLHLGDGVVMHQVVNGPSGDTGTPHHIGELSGTSGAEIGAQPIGGRYCEWIVGALNEDSTFAGVIRDSDYLDAWDGRGAAKFTKVGSGKLTLSGNNTYSGPTAIWDGELNVTGSLGSDTDVYLGDGAKLSGSGAMGDLLTLQSGGKIDVGNTPGAVGTMTTANGIHLKAGTLYFDLSSNPASGNDQIVNSSGTLTFDGGEGNAHFVINLIDGYLSEGTYYLITGGDGTSAPGSPVFTHNLTDNASQTYSLQRSGGGSTDTFVRLVVTDLDPEPPVAPTGLSATPGYTMVSLSWTASLGASGYVVKRSTTSGGPYATIATSPTAGYVDTGLINDTTYYYVVVATNQYGSSANSSFVSSTPTLGDLKINAGGPAVTPYVADSYDSGGGSWNTTSGIDVSGVVDPAPAAVYQTEHNGNFSYNVYGLTPGIYHLVRLHFAEIYHQSNGSRVFDVSINGTQVLDNFDIYAETGARYKAMVREFRVPSDAAGEINIQFVTVTDSAKVSGIEILSMSDPLPAVPVAYYRFEEGTVSSAVPAGGSQVDDYIGGDDNMNAYNAGTAPGYSASVPVPTIPRTGEANTLSTDYDGSDDDVYTAFAGPLVSTVYSNFTVEAYVNFSSLSGFQTIVGRDDSTDQSGGVDGNPQALLYLSKHLDNHFRVEVSTIGGDLKAVESAVYASAGTWYHVATVGDAAAGTLTLYVDGQNVGSVSGFDGLYPTTTHAWTIGRGQYNGYTADPVAGCIDEVRFSASALSPVQFLNAAADQDSDGWHDEWEIENLGTIMYEGSSDPDVDGLDIDTELAHGLSVFEFDPVMVDATFVGDSMEVTWPIYSTGWMLQYSTNVTSGLGWLNIPATVDTNVMSFPISSSPWSAIYFRLESP